MLATIDVLRREATKKLDQNKRADLGQYMTPIEIANFMATLFSNSKKKKIALLDAGAGIGSLSLAYLNTLLTKSDKPREVIVDTYELDPMLISYQNENFDRYKKLLAQQNIKLTCNINNSDFIVKAASLLKSEKRVNYSNIILNPPYKKINSDSLHRKLLSSVGIETVNLYSAFFGLAILMLEQKGELVAIIPRSFCNGSYYKAFRYLIQNNGAITRIHLFESRNEAFKDDNVLQESIIVRFTKGAKPSSVAISKSANASFDDYTETIVSYDKIIKKDDPEIFIHIPTEEMGIYSSFSNTLNDLNVQVSTGPVVDFRVKEYLHQTPSKGTIPLLYPVHFNGTEIEWPKTSKKPNAIENDESIRKMFYPKGFYTVVRRFSSKEEKQRIVARVVNPEKLVSDYIGIENHLNVFHYKKVGLNKNLAYGLAVYLNSAMVDSYFRTFNGHTQVNAGDLKQLKYPNKEVLSDLGEWGQKQSDFDPELIDLKIRELLQYE